MLGWLTARVSHSRSDRQLLDPFYRFQSVAEVQRAAQLGVQIDVNQAEVDDWLRLPGLSIHQAKALTALCQSGVALHCLEDVAAVLNVSVQRLKPLEPILLFCYYDPSSVCTIQPIDANRATVDMLLKIPSVDLHLARTIVAHRCQGPYRNLAHLQQRLSLPAQLTAELLHYLRF